RPGLLLHRVDRGFVADGGFVTQQCDRRGCRGLLRRRLARRRLGCCGLARRCPRGRLRRRLGLRGRRLGRLGLSRLHWLWPYWRLLYRGGRQGIHRLFTGAEQPAPLPDCLVIAWVVFVLLHHRWCAPSPVRESAPPRRVLSRAAFRLGESPLILDVPEPALHPRALSLVPLVFFVSLRNWPSDAFCS